MRGRVEVGRHRVASLAQERSVRPHDDGAERVLAAGDGLLRELERPLHEPCVALAQLSFQRRNTTQALWPPKPNEFETPISMSARRASFGM